jgi:hypothetical protein
VDGYAHKVTVLKNEGDGTFEDKAEFATGKGPSTSAAADFDGDGSTDLAVANWESGQVVVFLNGLSA